MPTERLPNPRDGENNSQPQPPARRLLAALLIVGCVLWVGVPIAGLALIANSNRSAVFAAEGFAWVAPEPSAASTSTPVDIALRWETPEPLRAPAWSGTVQRVDIAGGSLVESGDSVAVIDGITRIAWHAESPFYRQLASGSRGSDVIELKVLLSARGYQVDSTDSVTWSTVLAIRQLGTELGVPDAHSLTSFDPAWVVFLPERSFLTESVALSVAAAAPGTGESIAESSPRLTHASIVEPGAVTGDTSTGPEGTPSLSASAFAELVAGHGRPINDDETLVYAGTDIAADADSTSVAAEGLETLSAAVTRGTVGVPAQLRSAAVPGQVRIPAAGLSSINGQFQVCVADGADVHVQPVTVVASDAGGALITAEFRSGSTLRVPGPSASNPCHSTSAS